MRCTCGRRVRGEGGGCRGEIIRHRYVAESGKNEKPAAAPVIPAPRLPELRNRLALQSGLCDRLSRLRSLQHGRTFVIYAGQVTSQRSSQLSKRLSRCPARGAGTCSMSQQRDVPQPGVVCGTTDVKQEQKCDKKEACAACWVVVVLHCPAVQSALQLHAAQSRCLLSAVLATVQSGPVCTGQACTAVKTISAVSRQPFRDSF